MRCLLSGREGAQVLAVATEEVQSLARAPLAGLPVGMGAGVI